jgi:hypothetical protein
MNAATKLKPAAEPVVALPDVRVRLAAAQKRLSGLLAEQERLAVASVSSLEEEQKYFATVEKIAAVHGEIERFQKVREGLEAKEQQQIKDERSAAAAELRGRLGALLDRRLEVAQTFENAAVEMIKQMRLLVELSREAYQSFPGR